MKTIEKVMRDTAKQDLLRVYDNGGKTMDRFTVLRTDWGYNTGEATDRLKSAMGMSEDPRGFAYHSCAQPGRHLGKRIAWEDLPEACQKTAEHFREGLPEDKTPEPVKGPCDAFTTTIKAFRGDAHNPEEFTAKYSTLAEDLHKAADKALAQFRKDFKIVESAGLQFVTKPILEDEKNPVPVPAEFVGLSRDIDVRQARAELRKLGFSFNSGRHGTKTPEEIDLSPNHFTPDFRDVFIGEVVGGFYITSTVFGTFRAYRGRTFSYHYRAKNIYGGGETLRTALEIFVDNFKKLKYNERV